MSQYKETGNKVPVSEDELIQYVISKINSYVDYIKQTNNTPKCNPFMEPIIYTTTEGKTIMVPDYIKEKGIQMWSQQNNSPEINEIMIKSQKIPTPKNDSKVIYVYENKNDFWVILILVFAAILAAYLFYNISQDGTKSYATLDTDNIRYFLSK